MSTGSIALGRTNCAWAKVQGAEGTFAAPSATDYLPLVAAPSVKQVLNFTDDPQIRDTVSKLGRLMTGFGAGEINLQMAIKPSGSLGVAPAGDALLQAALGKKTVAAGASVTYSLADKETELPWLSLIVREGHIVWYVRDAKVSKLSTAIKAGIGDDALCQATFDLLALRAMKAGTVAYTGTLDGTGTPVTTITDAAVAAAMDVGAIITIGTDDNAGAGFTVTAKTDTGITFSPGMATSQANPTIKGWTPGIVDAGHLISGRFGTQPAGLGTIIEASLDLDNGLSTIEDEQTDDVYPTGIIRGQRSVEVSFQKYFRTDVVQMFAKAQAMTGIATSLQAAKDPSYASSAGKRLKWVMPNVQIDSPELSGDQEMKASIQGHAYATAAGDDELSLVFD